MGKDYKEATATGENEAKKQVKKKDKDYKIINIIGKNKDN